MVQGPIWVVQYQWETPFVVSWAEMWGSLGNPFVTGVWRRVAWWDRGVWANFDSIRVELNFWIPRWCQRIGELAVDVGKDTMYLVLRRIQTSKLPTVWNWANHKIVLNCSFLIYELCIILPLQGYCTTQKNYIANSNKPWLSYVVNKL